MELTDLPEDDRTAMAPSTPSGADERASQAPGDNALPIGTVLGEFEITGLIGEGGFGIVYLAYDHSLQRKVALKEYMPAGLASRKSGMTVAKSTQHLETFQAGLRSFINEARLLAQFDHPSLVKVHRFWEANGTAYMVMPFYEGRTLRDTLRQEGNPPGELRLKQLLQHLLDALEIIHTESCLHRDIAPDNILILKDGRPLLLDFGAARRVISNMTQNLTVILKPGYAPIEQYAEMESMKQGAWTDIYALAAVVYYAITGKTPVPAVSRIISDSLDPLSRLESGQGRYTPAFLHAIDKALAVKPEERPQSVAEFRALLDLAAPAPSSRAGPSPSGTKATIEPRAAIAPANGSPEFIRPKTGSPAVLYGSGAVVLFALIAGAWFFTREEPGQPPGPETTQEMVVAKPAPPADHPSPGETVDELDTTPTTSTPTSPPKPDVSPQTGVVAPQAFAPPQHEIQQEAPVKLPTEPEEKVDKRDKRVAPRSGSSSSRRAAAPPAEKDEPFPSAIEKIVTTNLREGHACLNNKNFECAKAKAETALQLEADNAAAKALLEEARTAQQKAWEASELK
jgi:serine/threonine protein kinase